jgi:hypothetical protein
MDRGADQRIMRGSGPPSPGGRADRWGMAMTFDLIDHLDRLIEGTSCRLWIDEIGDFIFGGYFGRASDDQFLDDVAQAGLELRRHGGLPLAVPVPPEIGFFLVSWAAEWLSDRRVRSGDGGINKATRRLRTIERKYGVDDVFPPWRAEEAPPDWRAADQEWERIADELLLDSLRSLAPDMAELFVADPTEYDRRREAGRQRFAKLVGRASVARPLEELQSELPRDG